MTTLQLNKELARQMKLISDDKELMRKVLDYVKSLTGQKKNTETQTSIGSDDLIHVDFSVPLPSDKYVGMISASREDDKKALEEYLSEKYNLK